MLFSVLLLGLSSSSPQIYEPYYWASKSETHSTQIITSNILNPTLYQSQNFAKTQHSKLLLWILWAWPGHLSTSMTFKKHAILVDKSYTQSHPVQCTYISRMTTYSHLYNSLYSEKGPLQRHNTHRSQFVNLQTVLEIFPQLVIFDILAERYVIYSIPSCTLDQNHAKTKHLYLPIW